MLYIELIKYEMDGDVHIDDSRQSLDRYYPCIAIPTTGDVGESLLLFLTKHDCLREKPIKEERDSPIVEEDLLVLEADHNILSLVRRERDKYGSCCYYGAQNFKDIYGRLYTMISKKLNEFANDPGVVIFISY